MNATAAAFTVQCLLLSLIAVGGANAVIPHVHGIVIGAHWLDEATFARVVAVAQIAPGPNLLYLPLIGWTLGGPLGAVLALLAFVTPAACLAVTLGRTLATYGTSPRVLAVRRALAPVAAGILCGAGIALARSVATARLSDIVIAVTVAVAATAFGGTLRWLCIIAMVGAVLG
jgi:chromate transporter